MASFVLIHDAMHGGWFWQPVQTQLVSMGHHAVAPDLAGSGADPTPLDLVNLDMISRRIADVVIDVAMDGPVILVGHGFGGLVIGEAAQRVPEHLLGLVYVSGVLATGGSCLRDVLQDGSSAGYTSPEGLVMWPDRQTAQDRFYNTSPPDRADRASRRLAAQAVRPLLEPATVTSARFGHVPRAYVECGQDRAIPLESQRRMRAVLPCDPVWTLDCDHSPAVSASEELTQILVSAGVRFAARGRVDVPQIQLEADEAVL
jgi:pimeloyl-ACP methyl ester carboxylesterase